MLTESCVGSAVVPVTLTVAGLKRQVAYEGKPVQAKLTWPVNPAAPVIVMGALIVLPACTVSVVVLPFPGAKVKAALTTWLRVAVDACVLASPE